MVTSSSQLIPTLRPITPTATAKKKPLTAMGQIINAPLRMPVEVKVVIVYPVICRLDVRPETFEVKRDFVAMQLGRVTRGI